MYAPFIVATVFRIIAVVTQLSAMYPSDYEEKYLVLLMAMSFLWLASLVDAFSSVGD